jgi:hypothetical protein
LLSNGTSKNITAFSLPKGDTTSMKLFIPKLGTIIRLTRPWTFGLHYEYRNSGLWDLMFAPPEMIPRPTIWKPGYQDVRLLTLEANTELKFSRIFIRKGQNDYDSVTFNGQIKHLGVIRKVRFWAKLDDVNKINYEVI